MTPTLPLPTCAATAPEVEMNPNQAHFVTQAGRTVSLVVVEILSIVVKIYTMERSEFIATHIDSRQQALKDMDARTSKLFIKMMEAINPAVGTMPMLIPYFKLLEMESQDPQINKKLVEGIALPHVKMMIAELDRLTPSIVDDIIKN